jgi:hypothetical protein
MVDEGDGRWKGKKTIKERWLDWMLLKEAENAMVVLEGKEE